MERWEELLSELRHEFIMREDELELLHEIDVRMLGTDQPLNKIFEFIVEQTRRLLGADRVVIFLRRGGSLESAYSTDEAALGEQFDVSARKFVIANSTTNIADVMQPPYLGEYVPIREQDGAPTRSLLSTPVVAGTTIAGVISAESQHPRAFQQVHVRILEAIAAQLALVLQRTQSIDLKKLFSEVDALIFAEPETQRVIPAALAKVMQALQVIEHVELSGAQIMFRHSDEELEVVHSTNPAEIGLRLPIEKSICGRAVRERRTVTIGDVSAEPEYRRMLGPSIQSEIAIPLVLNSSNVVIGVLNVESETPEAFEGFAQVILDTFAAKVITLLAFAKLRSDVTESMEVRSASDLLMAIGDQASNMIHRINNTVGAMRVRILELQDLDDRGDFGNYLVVTETLSALRALADQTLRMPEDVTRMLEQRTVMVNPNEVVRSVLAKVQIPGSVELEVDLDDAVPPLSLYSFDIVVENLLRNALDAMPAGGALSVRTSFVFHEELGNGYVELTVTDTGVGIPADAIPRIFDLNFSSKRSDDRRHGLGLWWVRNFVLRAKGAITVSSKVNAGSEFVVKVPVDANEASGQGILG